MRLVHGETAHTTYMHRTSTSPKDLIGRSTSPNVGAIDVEHTLHRKLKIGHPVPLKMELRNWKLQIAQIDQGRRRTSNICTSVVGVSPAWATRTSIGTTEVTKVRRNERNGNFLGAGRQDAAATAHNTSSTWKVPAGTTSPQTTERTIASPVGAFVASTPQERLRDVTARTPHKDPTAEERADNKTAFRMVR